MGWREEMTEEERAEIARLETEIARIEKPFRAAMAKATADLRRARRTIQNRAAKRVGRKPPKP